MGQAKFDVICHAPQVGVCGLDCKHCWVTQNLRAHKSLDEIKMMIDGLATLRDKPSLADLVLINFLDEVTLHPDVIEILSYCRERGVLPQQTLVTNGQGIAARDNWQEILDELKKCGIKRFLMTINGDEEYHDWFTGVTGSFQRTLTATRRANENGFDVIWNMYLTNENTPQVVESARRKGDDRFRLSVPVLTTRWMQWYHIHPEIDVLASLPDDVKGNLLGEFRSEADWVDLFLNGEGYPPNRDQEKGKSKNKVGSYFECNGKLYKEIALPEYEVGQVNYEELRSLYSLNPIPPGVVAEENIDMKEMVLKYGDPGSCKAFNFNGIKKKFIHNPYEASRCQGVNCPPCS